MAIKKIGIQIKLLDKGRDETASEGKRNDHMTLKYNLHDSLIEDVQYIQNEKRIEMKIELCNWMQSGYKDTEPELVGVRILFDEVKHYEISVQNFKFDSNEILDVLDINENTLKIVFMAEKDVETILISSDKVTYFKIQ